MSAQDELIRKFPSGPDGFEVMYGGLEIRRVICAAMPEILLDYEKHKTAKSPFAEGRPVNFDEPWLRRKKRDVAAYLNEQSK